MKVLQTRRDFMKAVGLTTAGVAVGGCQSADLFGPGSKRPNVVVILTDDQRDD